ncbi:MAG: hypothetical protein NTY12_00945 [Candidatus Falkowbacteria bacterium]|nr:hypothetical protein [Candidatus Falkowbacteria bacterium]
MVPVFAEEEKIKINLITKLKIMLDKECPTFIKKLQDNSDKYSIECLGINKLYLNGNCFDFTEEYKGVLDEAMRDLIK